MDGVLVSDDWTEDHLLAHLCGNDGPPYRISNLNGHATHYELGVPGVSPIGGFHGLDTPAITDPNACVASEPLNLAGNLIYGVGCHEGLPVAGGTGLDNPLDVPQALASRGVVAHLANSGYGWGLKCGVGYSELLVRMFTEQLIDRGSITVGAAVQEAKLRYFRESLRIDPYDLKTSRQWRLTGIPNLALNIGTGSPAAAASGLSDDSGVEHMGPVTVERRLSAGSAAGFALGRQVDPSLPDDISRLDLHFDFTDDGVYTKYRVSGEVIDSGLEGCPGGDTPDPQDPLECTGCYYTLNGLVELTTDEADLPVQPYFVFDSRLSGVVQQGVLWKGGVYQREEGWVPIFGTLISDGEIDPNRADLPRRIYIKPRGPRRPSLKKSFSDACHPGDPENETIVFTTAEIEDADDPASELAYSILKLHRKVDLEVFYSPEAQDGTASCDQAGPVFGTPTYGEHYHRVEGTEVHWEVPVTDDDSDVWRVVVVYDAGPDAQGRGEWVPLELTDPEVTGIRTGSLRVLGSSQITYYLQAVDNHGNVSWRDYGAALPPSGIPREVPWPADVSITGSALTADLSDDPDPVWIDSSLTYTIGISNLGPDPAENVHLSHQLPAGVTFLNVLAPSWYCEHSAGWVTCNRATLAPGSAPAIRIDVKAPSEAGTIVSEVSLTADNAGTVGGSEETEVIDETKTDLAVVNEDGGLSDGWMITYWITVTNHGPNPVTGATVTDFFPHEPVDVVWDCMATPGSTCTAHGSGNIVDSVNLTADGAVAYAAAAAVFKCPSSLLRNTAAVALPSGMTDYNPDNNNSTVSTACNLTFADGFESGDCSAWSNGPARILLRDKDPQME